ncbi:glycosyl hydrolase family 95 catalytic domain-containing protein, partial [Thomasclavelia ramosa]|uniref:glycosyl hydrolase family 95 catalytic domain-containing protein n=1 Tax=Thomasclavelia ramosa TaxID=1547 RepID=UPI00352EAE5B
MAPCPTGGVWILTHIWEHYLYTGDLRFLEKVFPLVEEAVEFFLEYVYQTESGEYTCGPSISPENSFLR